MEFSYKVQDNPNGIAQAFLIGEEFIDNQPVTLILGDNLFYGHGYLDFLKGKLDGLKGALIFGYSVKDPERYGVVEFNQNGKVTSIEEKPKHPKSKFAVPGLYVYDRNVVEITKSIKPSARGELEITDVNIAYLKQDELNVHILSRGVAWLDTGTHRSLLEAGTFIETLESRQGLKVGCIEEIAFTQGFITKNEFKSLISSYPNNDYTEYLTSILESN
jgi:glucose-1-phosphate thymidylyltransferase